MKGKNLGNINGIVIEESHQLWNWLGFKLSTGICISVSRRFIDIYKPSRYDRICTVKPETIEKYINIIKGHMNKDRFNHYFPKKIKMSNELHQILAPYFAYWQTKPDITAVLKYIRVIVWESNIREIKYNEKYIEIKKIWDYKLKIIEILNKPLNLYTKQEEIDLLELLKKLWNY